MERLAQAGPSGYGPSHAGFDELSGRPGRGPSRRAGTTSTPVGAPAELDIPGGLMKGERRANWAPRSSAGPPRPLAAVSRTPVSCSTRSCDSNTHASQPVGTLELAPVRSACPAAPLPRRSASGPTMRLHRLRQPPVGARAPTGDAVAVLVDHGDDGLPQQRIDLVSSVSVAKTEPGESLLEMKHRRRACVHLLDDRPGPVQHGLVGAELSPEIVEHVCPQHDRQRRPRLDEVENQRSTSADTPR